MTKREICERLMYIRDLTRSGGPAMTREAILHLLLDLAAPDDHFADAGKKEPCPGVIAKPGKD